MVRFYFEMGSTYMYYIFSIFLYYFEHSVRECVKHANCAKD